MIFRYVTHDDVADYIAKGWEVESDLSATHHGRRIEQAYAQPDLFVASPEPKPEQLNLLEAAE